ncbi:GerAB/ArcD/ProY family transporter [Aneurinibacillus aneurinilyticus]|jgi:spore germination protein (amino acid permease)|uniref:GerAB/ArcD/ProY family transporter n=2 Tax=Aneurinibacillus aneurinilyticus TaxID=1391 RepID=A0A848CVS0_ANEAE|nr:GerAB/ArcD/ProY family transporter [Aneurinibacillus aneurinilyticus]ERI08576.1 spore germination protein [Aneurinibacillus aneurinilyticus ATCC 12856]MCI1693555.1 spore germination protein [Aneurinibacillus aneurinilyticus]MED0672343.1 GerAB/ArcD/ProY family transporter [Aneurinibacillus aneurinilyticus]MED0706102.1 GerAB/ArcD/ProY family transporter [Aneurinibacillus aneurinilyticus]MED0725076.1 GerAB/ArcD/ProY family transporter [Aneurinibacillus aneurinilyticus]
MATKNSTITQGQLTFFIFQTQIGVGLLSLPFAVAKIAHGDGWISTLLIGFFIQLCIFLIWALNRRFPTLSLYEFMPQIIGKPVAFFFTLLYSLYFIGIGGVVLLLFSNIINNWVFDVTPRWALILLMVSAGIYLARENIRIIARFHVFISFFAFILIFLACMAYAHIDIRYILPIGHSGALNIIKASSEALLSMLGFEALLVIFPYVENNEKGVLKAMSIANLIATSLSTFLVFTCLIVFSPQEILVIPQPMLYMLKSFTFTVIERLDLFFLSIWITFAVTSFVSYLYLASKGLGYAFHKNRHKNAVWYAAIACGFIALYPDSQLAINRLAFFITRTSFAFFAAIPLTLLLLSHVLRKKERKDTAS